MGSTYQYCYTHLILIYQVEKQSGANLLLHVFPRGQLDDGEQVCLSLLFPFPFLLSCLSLRQHGANELLSSLYTLVAAYWDTVTQHTVDQQYTESLRKGREEEISTLSCPFNA